MNRTLVAVGAFMAALGVMLGAFGAHSLPNMVAADSYPNALANWQTAAHYHVSHAFGMAFVGLVCAYTGSKLARVAGWLFFFGILVFGGSLYAMALGAPRFLGAITPIGGASFIAGWIALGIAALKA